MNRLKTFLSILVFGMPACKNAEGPIRVGPVAAWKLAADAANSACVSMVKHPALSKTIWLNAIVAAGLLAEANIAQLQGILPPNKYAWIAFGLPIANMLLRVYTSKGLSFKPAMPAESEAVK